MTPFMLFLPFQVLRLMRQYLDCRLRFPCTIGLAVSFMIAFMYEGVGLSNDLAALSKFDHFDLGPPRPLDWRRRPLSTVTSAPMPPVSPDPSCFLA